MQTTNILAVTNDRGDKRFDIPYSGGTDEFKLEFERLEKLHTIGQMLAPKGAVGEQLQLQFLPDTKPIVKRLELIPCLANTANLNLGMKSLVDSLEKNHHKFGVLLIVASTDEELQKANEWAIATAVSTEMKNNRTYHYCCLEDSFPGR